MAELTDQHSGGTARQLAGVDLPEWYDYKPGDTAASGDTIVEILQRSRKCFVFVNQAGVIQWEYSEDCIDGDNSSDVAMHLVAQVTGSLWKGRARRRVLGIIADALAQSLDGRKKNDQRDFFANARIVVQAARSEALHVTYLVAAATATGILGTVLLLIRAVAVSAGVDMYLLCALLAGVGAFLSVLLRFKHIPIEAYTSHLYTSVGALSRVLLGAVFGAVFLLFQQAGILFTVLKEPAAVAAAALVAGFSERLVPELLSAFETKLTPAAENTGTQPNV